MICPSRPFGLALGLVLALAATVRGAGPAEALFRLVPPDVSATLAIEDLREHAREFLASPVVEGFRRFPVLRDRIASGPFARFEQAAHRLEAALGEKMSTIRDELLGEAVVLSLRIPPNGRPEDARGLLLVRVRNRPLLDRLVRGVNAAQLRSGELTRVDPTSRGGVTYWTRVFRAGGGRPNEYYTVLKDDTVAWSNAEDLIQGVINRRAGKAPSLADEPMFRRVRGRLPERSSVSLFVDPQFLAQIAATSPTRQQRPADDRASALIVHYLGALDYLGASLEWRDGILLHTEEVCDPAKLDPWVRRWAARPGEIGPNLRSVPDTAMAMASVHVDFPAVLEFLRMLAPAEQQARIDNLLLALDGVLMGHNAQAEVLPQLGPGVLAYLEASAPDSGMPARLTKVLVIGLGNAGGLGSAIENALQTLLAFHALDTRHGDGQLRVESREVDGRKVTALRPSSPFAFAIEGDRVVLASNADAAARAFSPAAGVPGGEFERLRTRHFPEAGSFACVDLARLGRYLLGQRASLVSRLASRQQRTLREAEDDLDQALALMSLFRQAYLTSALEPDASAAHRTLGLIANDAVPAP